MGPPNGQRSSPATAKGRADSGGLNEASFRLMVDGVVDYAILMLDLDGHVATWNAGAQQIKGYLSDEIIGRHFSVFYTDEDIAAGRPEDGLRIAGAAGRFEDDAWRVRKDGTQFWANVVITPMRDERGQLIGYGKVTRDLGERGAAVLMLDVDGRVATWNAGAARFKGYRSEEIIGQDFSVFYPAEDIAAGKPRHELTLAANDGRFEDAGWRVRKDGTQFWATVVITALRDRQGQLFGYRSSTADLTERRTTELRLQASQALVTGVLAAATEFSIIGTDLDGLITVFNSGAERMLGYSASEMIGLNTPALILDADEVAARGAELQLASAFDILVHEARPGRADTREWTYVGKTGTRIRVSLVVTAMRDEDEALVGYIAIARDVTQSAMAEAERAALARVARAVAAAEDVDDVLSLVTREVGEMHHFEAAAIVRFDDGLDGTVVGAWSRSGRLSPGQRLSLDDDSASAVVRTTGRVAGFRRYCADSSEILRSFGRESHLIEFGAAAPIVVGGRTWGALTIAASIDRTLSWAPEEGLVRFAAFVSFAISNAEQRRALQRGRDELRSIIDELPASVWVCDPAGDLLLANQTFNELALDSLLAERALDPAAVSPSRIEETLVDVSGRERTLVVARSPLRDRTGEIYAICGVATDITERRAIERAKDEFVSVVSHELRTPLSAIRGALALLADERDLDSVSQRRMIEIALSSSERLSNLINDILDLQRIESGLELCDLQSCDAAALVSDAAEAMESLGSEHGVSIETDATPFGVRADPRLVAQVLVNLIGNAIKFSPVGGRVIVGAKRSGDEVRFFVRDEGQGIPADKLELVFERFLQLDSSDSRIASGTGLGLAICRQIADRHEGRIWAESEGGHGSCFLFALPLLSDDTDLADPSSTATSVVVCGDPSARNEIRRLLESSGLMILEAATLADAVRVEEPALLAILVDLESLDRESQALATGDARPPDTVPLVVMSTANRPETVDSAHEWVAKPATADRLLAALGTVNPLADSGVLIVEDDDSLASVLVERLARKGFAAMHARSGSEAIAMATWSHPSVLVLDVALPAGDGYEVVEVLRARNVAPRATVIYAAAELARDAQARLRLGPTEFFTKSRTAPEQFNDHLVGLLDGLRSRAIATAPITLGSDR
jgi:PAS domain S-box-containing protein